MFSFFRNPPVELPAISLADEAVSAVGFQDAMRAQGLSDLRALRSRLAANISAETKALAVVDEQIAREERAQVGMALAIADVEIAAEIEHLEHVVVDDYDAAEGGRKSYDVAVEAKRKRGDKHWPKRPSDDLVAAE